MNGLWKKRIAAMMMTLVMLASLMPAALATGEEGTGSDNSPTATDPATPTTPTNPGDSGSGGDGNQGGDTPTDPCAGGHTWSTAYTSDGASGHYRTCTKCGQKDTIEAHIGMDRFLPSKAATCIDPGEEKATCSAAGCGYSVTQTTAATGIHEYGDAWVSDANGHYHVCKTAGCSAKGDESGHTLVSVNTPSTCTTPGKVGQKCNICNYEAGMQTLPLAAHTPDTSKYEHNDTSHWRVCSVCEQKIDSTVANHTFDSANKCVCGYIKAATTVTVTFQTLNTNGAAATTTQNVAVNGKPTNPGTPSAVTFGGKTYTFRGWTTTAGNPWYVYSNQALVTPSGQAITKATTFYAVYTAATGFTVTYLYPTSTGATSTKQEVVVSGAKPTGVPSPLRSFTANGTTYTFSRWSTLSGTPWYLYSSTSQTAVSPAGVPVTRNVTYYALYTASASTSITVTAAPGKSASFDVAKFRDAYQTKYPGETPSYVEFSVGRSDYEEFPGAVYSGSTALTRSEFIDGSYNYSGSKGLANLSFQADRNAKNNSSLSITYTIYGPSSGRYVTGTLTLKVSGSARDGDIEYEVAPGKYVNFRATDFRSLLRSEYGGAAVDYVQFKQPDSSAFSNGTLYYDYGGGSSQVTLTRSNLSGYKFYYSPGKNDYDLDDLTFAAGNNFKSKITLEFTVYGTGASQSVTGTLVITSTSSTTRGDIEYEVAPGKTVDLNRTDFREFLRDEEGKSVALDYVQFSRPSSTSVFNDGTLYYDYGGGSGEVTLTRTNISGYKFYYAPGKNDYDLDDLTFAADRSFTDEISLDFTAYGTDGEYAKGTLVIRSTAQSDKLDSGDINYKVAPGQSVTVKISDFRALLRKEYNSKSDVDYVVFRRPASSSVFDNGTLYYNKGASGEVTLTRNNLSSYKFHYAPGKNEYDLSKLTFVAGNTFKDSITLDFTIYGEDADEDMDGTLVFYTDASAAAASGYVGSIRYTTVPGTNVQINADDIARFLKKSLPGYTLQYVTLGGVPSNGTLYYNYYSASRYGATARTLITSSNYTSQLYYFAPTATTQYALTELTYVPSGYNYCASIPFTAYATSSLSVSGTILISVTQQAISEVYGITPRGAAVNFPSSDIYTAVLSATGTSLYSIQLLKLPSSNAGTIYVGSGTTTKAATNVQYTYASGASSISQLRFVPTGTFTGSVEIPYVALNSNGTAVASGVFALGVVNGIKSFSDMPTNAWCYKYVAELADANVIGGYSDGTFKADNTVSYGAALKLIMLAAGYPEQAPTGKNVFSGYLDRARADGLVTRSNVNLAAPITRLQVAQLAAGALKLSTSNLSSVKPFTDTSDLYVQALNAAGIVGGYFSNGTSTYRPNNSLTRGQMSAIVWRMLNYRRG